MTAELIRQVLIAVCTRETFIRMNDPGMYGAIGRSWYELRRCVLRDMGDQSGGMWG